MENLVDNSLMGNEFGLSNNSLRYLNETRKWTLFMSIFGLFIILLMVIGLFAMNALMSGLMGMSGMSGMNSGVAAMPGVAMTVLFLFFIVVYFFPVYFLLQFSLLAKRALDNKDSDVLQRAFRFLNLHYRYMGILLIIVLSFYVLAGIIALLAR